MIARVHVRRAKQRKGSASRENAGKFRKRPCASAQRAMGSGNHSTSWRMPDWRSARSRAAAIPQTARIAAKSCIFRRLSGRAYSRRRRTRACSARLNTRREEALVWRRWWVGVIMREERSRFVDRRAFRRPYRAFEQIREFGFEKTAHLGAKTCRAEMLDIAAAAFG